MAQAQSSLFFALDILFKDKIDSKHLLTAMLKYADDTQHVVHPNTDISKYIQQMLLKLTSANLTISLPKLSAMTPPLLLTFMQRLFALLLHKRSPDKCSTQMDCISQPQKQTKGFMRRFGLTIEVFFQKLGLIFSSVNLVAS